jgi:hypothetical protein
MVKGIDLTLLIGPAVPVPVPKGVLDALTGVEVRSNTHEPSGFQLTFNLSNQSPLHTAFLLSAGSMLPIMRVILVAIVNGTPEVLADGVVTKQDIAPGSEAGFSTLTITGVDLTALMDLIDFDGIPYPAMPPEARVLLILAKYAFLGIVPLVLPSIFVDVPIPTERIPRHQGKDLEYIRRLAAEVGYVFYIDPGPVPGTNVAYWGPEIKIGIPQPALNTNMDAHTNVESMSFTFDTEAKTLPVVFIHNQLTKVPIPIPIPDINPLNPPLGLVPPLPLKIEFKNNTARLTPVQALAAGAAEASRSSDAVSGSGSLDVLRYGRILKARRLVGVRGAGTAFDGLYYVKSVTHAIKRGEYKQRFTLTRNGLISILPQVPA